MEILSLKEKTTRYISNNFTILNKNYNIWGFHLSKKKLSSAFYSLSHCISPIIFSYSLYFSLFPFTCSHSHSSSRLQCPQSHSRGSVLFSSTPNGRMVFPLFLHLFLLFFLSTRFTSNHNKCKHPSLDFCT